MKLPKILKMYSVITYVLYCTWDEKNFITIIIYNENTQQNVDNNFISVHRHRDCIKKKHFNI